MRRKAEAEVKRDSQPSGFSGCLGGRVWVEVGVCNAMAWSDNNDDTDDDEDDNDDDEDDDDNDDDDYALDAEGLHAHTLCWSPITYNASWADKHQVLHVLWVPEGVGSCQVAAGKHDRGEAGDLWSKAASKLSVGQSPTEILGAMRTPATPRHHNRL